MRALHTPHGTYHYRIGASHAVIEDPHGNRKRVSLPELTGRPAHLIERGRWKKTSDGMVRPAHVRAYIDKQHV